MLSLPNNISLVWMSMSALLPKHVCTIVQIYQHHFSKMSALLLKHVCTVAQTCQRYCSNIELLLTMLLFSIATLFIFLTNTTTATHVCVCYLPYIDHYDSLLFDSNRHLTSHLRLILKIGALVMKFLHTLRQHPVIAVFGFFICLTINYVQYYFTSVLFRLLKKYCLLTCSFHSVNKIELIFDAVDWMIVYDVH